MDDALQCACARKHDGGDVLADFAVIRAGCPVLRQIQLPDAIWSDCQAAIAAPADDARHQSILVLAFDRGHLEHVTAPLHRYLISEGQLRAGLRKQYLRDLREDWLLDTDPLERHRKARRFMGKLNELIVAQWLEGAEWRIANLEAFREGVDIVAEREAPVAFEVKYLGREDADFEAIVDSLKNGPSVNLGDPYAAISYFVFRVYEAAKQLQRAATRRVVVFVVDETTWHTVALQLKNNWIDWSKAKLYPGGTPWREFLDAQLRRYPDIEKDGEVAATIRSLDELWILKMRYGFELVREYDFRLAGERAVSPGA